MTGVVLAAGRGARLNAAAGQVPKCLVRIGGRPLLLHQLDALGQAGIANIVVVAGFGAPLVRSTCPQGVRIVENKRFRTTNSLHSLWLTRDLLGGGFVVLNGDVLFHPGLLSDLLTARYEDALLMCARGDATSYTDEEMKIHTRRGLVVAIDKALADPDCDGENIGIAKFGSTGAAVLVEAMEERLSRGGHREWLPRAFQVFAERRPLHVVESRGYPWTEIDFPEDYWRACTQVLPAIEADAGWAVLHAHAARAGRVVRHV
jgi:choline kinase